MRDGIVFLRRQSPGWAAFARDHRRGRNRRVATNFFTTRAIFAYRAICAWLPAARIGAAARSRASHLEAPEAAAALAATARFLMFFHDDDNLFATDLARLRATDAMIYASRVSPLYRTRADLFTFAREALAPTAAGDAA